MDGYWKSPDPAVAKRVKQNWKAIEKHVAAHPYAINWGPVRPNTPRMAGLHPDFAPRKGRKTSRALMTSTWTNGVPDPMLNTPFPPGPDYTDEEASAVTRVLKSNRVNYWTGEECRAFEREFAEFGDTSYAIALANGTVALELAVKALGIGEGDEVIVTPRSFLASASCVTETGAVPVFVDVDPDSQNITAATIDAAIGASTRAILCVHHAGWPCDMEGIVESAHQHGLAVIEDCAQAHGARYRGRPVGSFGDIGAWSFCQDKIMTTGGEGGMVTTNDRELWSRMWSLKDHGKSYEAVYEREHPPGFRWLHESFGTNGRMTEMQAAIGRIQLKRMPEWHKRRLEIANTIWNAARALSGLRVPEIPDHIEHAAYKCYVFVRPDALKARLGSRSNHGRNQRTRRAVLLGQLPGGLSRESLRRYRVPAGQTIAECATARRDQPDVSLPSHIDGGRGRQDLPSARIRHAPRDEVAGRQGGVY